MAKDTSKLSPRIIINENDIQSKVAKDMISPVTLIFGFSQTGKTNEMVVCNSQTDVLSEFGFPTTAPEKYFIDSALRLIGQGATAIMTRLPYDNFQCHQVKFVDYKIEEPIGIQDIITGPKETETRKRDNIAVEILKELRDIDPLMTQVQRISQKSGSSGIHIGHMTNEQLIELELDPKEKLESNTFRIVDIKGSQYGVGAAKKQYTGIFPMIVTAPMALYYQNKIQNTTQMDDNLKMIDSSEGIEISSKWFRTWSKTSDKFKEVQSEIIYSIKQELNFNTATNKFHRSESFQDTCTKKFPVINFLEKDKIEKTYLKNIGLLVCKIDFDSDRQISTLSVVESFVGLLGVGKNAIDRKINSQSKYIRMYKNLSIPTQTDTFICDNQKITSLGMEDSECQKDINYKTSILDPIEHNLEHIYSDIDSIKLDVILDAGLSSVAFAAYVTKNKDGESYIDNNKVTTKINWSGTNFSMEDQIQDYAMIWDKITRMFGDFCQNVRGDCIYLADGPRITNLERNYPIANYIDMDNIEMFNDFLPYFNGYSNNYVARYWNWVYMEDMQYENRGLWVPGSVVMGSQLAYNDHQGKVWYAPAGQNRGIIENAYDVSIRTKPYNSENDILYQNHWNFFTIYQNTGVVTEGQKTMQTKKTSLDRINVRRLICYIKQQLRIIGNKYKYEPNTETMRDSFVNDIYLMLMRIQQTSGISDFKIKCDNTNNTIQTIDRHELYCKIAVKPIKALEYIIIDLDLINGSMSIGDNSVVKAQ